MAQNASTGEMVLVNGVRFRKEDVERLGVKGDVKPLAVPVPADKDKVTTAPGAVVAGDQDGHLLINTEKSSAGNVVVTDAGATEVSGEAGGSGGADKAAGDKSGTAARSAKGK